MLYPTSKTTGNNILTAFTAGNRQVLLAAQMQSGKSETFLYVAYNMLRTGAVRRVVIICGNNENELHEQLVRSKRTVKNKYVHDIATSLGYTAEMTAALRADAKAWKSKIRVYKSSDLTSTLAPLGNDTLLIWDESHYAQTTANRPYKFIRRSGLLVNGTPASDASWAAKNSYFLSVSATPFAEYSDTMHVDHAAAVTRNVVFHDPGADYRGVADYTGAGMIMASYSLKEENAEAFKALLRRHAGMRTYALVRTRDMDNLASYCAEVGVAFCEYSAEAPRTIVREIDDLKNAPAQFTVVGLRGMCRMGKVVPKQHIAFVFESSVGAKSDCLLQSLLGRMCGYGPFGAVMPEIYVSPNFLEPNEKTGLSEITRYIQWAVARKVVIPQDASCLGAPETVSGKFVLHPRHVEVDLAGAGPYTAAAKDRFVEVARADIVAHPYADPLQQADALRLLEDAGEVTIHRYDAATYEYVQHAETGIAAIHAAGERWDEVGRWQDAHFKIYFEEGHFWFCGYTEEAEEDTKTECRAPITKTTDDSVWHATGEPVETEPVPQERHRVTTASELNKLKRKIARARASGKRSRHTVYVSKELKKDPFVKELLTHRLPGRGGGMNLPAAESAGLYRFVMEIRIPPPVVAADAPAHAGATAEILAAAIARMEAARAEVAAAAAALMAARGVQLPHAPVIAVHRA